MDKHYDVAIYGATMGANYGGLVTYYALYKAIEQLGYSTVMIMPPLPKHDTANRTFATDFCEKYHEITDRVYLNELGQFNDIADQFILGSDQIWNYTLFPGKKETFYLDFVNDNKKKLAYGASFGFNVPTIFPDNVDRYPAIYKDMNRLDYIGVREEDAVEVCEKYYNADARQVLDPVFLVKQETYRELSQNAPRKQKDPYMCVYSIGPKTDLNKVFQYVSQKLKLPRVNMCTGNKRKFEMRRPNFDMPYMEDVLLEEWIYNIINADFVVTDSFHCLCFSIMFRKKFILVQKSWATSRMESLLNLLGLKDRWFQDYDDLRAHPEVFDQEIDYDRVHAILDKEIESSRSWLSGILSAGKNVDIRILLDVDSKEEKYQALYEAKNLNAYFKALAQYDDIIYVMAKKGVSCGLIDNVKFPAGSGIGPNKKEKMKTKGFVMTGDQEKQAFDLNFGTLAHMEYRDQNVKFSAMSEGPSLNTAEKSAEIYMVKDGKKTVYATRRDGLYVLVYSKSLGKVVDYIRTNIDTDEKYKVHHQIRQPKENAAN